MSDPTVGACDYLYKDVKRPDFVPNPDVSGIGVLLGFLATAYLTFLFVVVYYLTGCVEETFTNEIDKMFLAKCSLRKYFKSVRRLELTLQRAVLIFSDQQVVTGIALLSSGFAQLKSGIAVYHWQILVYLAWFSSLTHLTTLTVLRQYFQDNDVARLWRSILMLVTVTMLGVALLPTGDGIWMTSGIWRTYDHGLSGMGHYSEDTRSVPALCFFQRIISEDPNQKYTSDSVTTNTMILSLFVLVSGYLTRFIKLSKKATALSRRWIRTLPSRKFGSLRDCALKRVARPSPKVLNSHWVSAYVLLETLCILLRALLDISESMLWEILWLAFALVWGTRNLFVTRAYYSDNAENTWGFGQLFPALLLVLPLLSIVENYYEKGLSPLPKIESAASGGHGNVRNNVQPRLLRVGQWGPNAAASGRTNLVRPDDPLIIRRTGTDIQIEEEQLDSIDPGVSQHSDSPAETHNTSLPASGSGSPPRKNGPDQAAGCYEFEWVWILVLMLITSVSAVIVFTLTFLTQFVLFWRTIMNAIGCTLVFCFCFTAAFVTLSYYHGPLRKTLGKYLRISPEKQHTILRTLAWLCLPVIVATVILVLLGLSLPS